jgi:hypothetical protein
MSQALAGLPDGGVSEVLVLPFGCAVLQLVERRVLEPVSYAQAKEALSRECGSASSSSEYRTWIEELRGHSYIERHGYFADAARLDQQTFPVASSRSRSPAVYGLTT